MTTEHRPGNAKRRPKGAAPANGRRPKDQSARGNGAPGRPAGTGRRPARRRTDADHSGGYEEGTKPRKKTTSKKKKKNKRIALFVLEFFLLLLMIGVLYGVSKMDLINREEVDESNIVINAEVHESESLKGYKNVALFGVDSRKGKLGKGERTDTIMIASLNEDTGDIKLLSVYRDTYLNLGNDTYDKANNAYAKGGPEQAINMLNMNLDLNITDYVTVDFRALVDVIDALGGIPIELTEEEIVHLNNYQIETAEVVGGTQEKIVGAGVHNLNGIQAVSYSRIRYTAGDDYKRTERQRTVLIEIAKKAKNADIGTLNQIVNKVFPKVLTSFSNAEMLKYAAGVMKYNVADTTGFPFDKKSGRIGKKGSCVVPTDLNSNVVKVHEFFFGTGTEGYSPSAAVQEYNQKITSDTSSYL